MLQMYNDQTSALKRLYTHSLALPMHLVSYTSSVQCTPDFVVFQLPSCLKCAISPDEVSYIFGCLQQYHDEPWEFFWRRVGMQRASLSEFLQYCQQRLDNSDAQSPGNSALKPLHVIMQVSLAIIAVWANSGFRLGAIIFVQSHSLEMGMTWILQSAQGSMQQQQHQSWAAKALQLFVSIIVVPTMWLMFLVAGWMAIKSSLPNPAVASTTGTGAAGPMTPGAMFAPKEYNKVWLADKIM